MPCPFIGLCRRFEEMRGIGVEASGSAIEDARARVSRDGLDDRICLIHADALDFADHSISPDLALFAFVLQEFLGETSRAHLVAYLSSIRQNWPQCDLLVIEVDYRPHDRERLSTPIGTGYYNPYYLLHFLTHQELIPRSEWEQIFHDAGYLTVAAETVDAEVDPSGLEIGYLLRPCT